MSKLSVLGIILLMQLIPGCGFQLRGNYDFPEEFSSVYVESSPGAQELATKLVQSLNTGISSVVQTRADATAVLRIISNSFAQRTLSFDSRGRPREFEITYTAEFEVTTGGREFLSRQSISLSREFEFDGIDVGAGGNQREVIRDDLQTLMVRSILQRISARS